MALGDVRCDPVPADVDSASVAYSVREVGGEAMTDRGREEAEMIVLKWLEDNCLHAGVAPWYGPDDAPSYLEAKYIAPLEQLIAVALSRARAAAIEEACKAVCFFCAEGKNVDRNDYGEPSHLINDKFWPCDAVAIRSLSQQEDGKWDT